MPIIFLKWCDWNILEVIIHFKSQKLSGNNLITVAWTLAAQEKSGGCVGCSRMLLSICDCKLYGFNCFNLSVKLQFVE